MATVLPTLINTLVTNFREAIEDTDLALVYDGFQPTADPGQAYLMVGVDDVDAQADAFSADSHQEWANANGTARDENGEIVCAAVAWNGDADQQAARDEAFKIVAAVEDVLRANPCQDVPGVLWTSYGSRTALSQDQNQHGAAAIVVFRIHYRARI